MIRIVMTNPFPGVNPFIESTADLWVGFHNALISNCSQQLNPTLIPRGYAAVIEKRIDLVDTEDGGDMHRRPDFLVMGSGQSAPKGARFSVDIEPARTVLPQYETQPVAYIQVRSFPGREVVTTIEILSPGNKSGGSRRDYLGKRASILATSINLVEIDLLLGGRRPDVYGEIPAGEFAALVSRGDNRPNCDVYPWSIRRVLPKLPIPLKSGDDDACLDLASAYQTTYDGGPYPLLLSYDQPLAGLISDEDRKWIAERTA
jgi:hypothetical protein